MADTQINVGMNVEGVITGTEKAKRKISELGGAARDAGNEAGKGMAAIGGGGDAAAKKVESATKSMVGSLQRQIAAMESGDKSSRAYQESLARMRGVDPAILQPYLDQLDAVKEKQKEAAESMKDMDKAGTGLKSKFESMSAGFAGASAGMAAGIAAATAAFATVAGLASKFISVQREFDVLNSSLITVTGSSAKAAQEFLWIKKFAATTPYQLNEVTQAFVKMKTMGLDASEASLKSYGNTASAMGKGLNQMIEAVADAATGEFERLKEFGIKARKSGDDVSLTFQGVTKTIGNNAEEITGYLKSIGDVEFAAAMIERAKTLDGVISNLTDSWDELFRTINEGGLGNAFEDLARVAANDVGILNTALKGLIDTMINSKNAGDGLMKQLANGAGFAIGTAAVGTLNSVFNGFNWTVNALTGNILGLNEGMRLLPESLMTNEQRAAALSGKLQDAESDLAKLQKQLSVVPDNIYLKSSTHQAFLLVQQLRAAKAAQDSLANTGNAGRGLVNPSTIAQINEELVKNQQRVSDLLFKGSGVPEGYIKRMKEIGELNAAGALSAHQLAEALDGAQSMLKKNTAGQSAAKKALSEQNKELAEQAKILAELSGYSADYEATQQRYAALLKSGKMNQDAYNRAVNELVAKQPGMLAASKLEAEALKAIEKARTDGLKSHAKELETLGEKAQKLEDEVTMYGMSKEAIEQLTTARMLDQIEVLKGFDNSAEEIARIEQTIAARKRLAAAGSAKDVKDAGTKAARDLQKAHEKAAKESSKYWEDALMRAFESGKGFFQSLWDTIKNTLKTQVLRVMVQGTLGSLGMGAAGAASAGAGASTAGSILGNAGSYSVNSLLTSAFPGAMAAASTFGTAALAGVQSMVGLVGTTAQAATAAANGIAAASQIAAGQAITGSAAASAGSMAAAAVPYVAAALALYAIAQKTKGEERAGAQYGYSTNGQTVLDPFTGGSRAPATTRTTDITGAQFLHGPSGGDPYAEDVKKAIDSTVTGINTLFSRLGTETAITSFQGGYESSGKGRGGVLAGGTLSTGATFGESGTGSNYNGDMYETTSSTSPNIEEAMKNFSADLMQATVQALQAAVDIPQTIKEMLAGIDAESLSTEAAAQLLTDIDAVTKTVTTFNAVAKSLPFENLTDLSFDAAAGLIAAAGGMDALGANLGTYYTNFYDAEEQRAQAVKNMADALAKYTGETEYAGWHGVYGPDRATSKLTDQAIALQGIMDTLSDPAATEAAGESLRKQFRAIAESQDLTTASGQQMYAQMISVSGAFAELTPVVKATEAAIDSALEKMKEDASTLAIDLMTAQGKTAEAAAAQRALDTKGYSDLAVAQYDANVATRGMIDALEDAAVVATRGMIDALEDAAVVAQERAGLESALLGLQGNTVALRNRELAALDPSNRALQESIYALQDATTAQEAYNTALSNAQSKFDSASSALKSARDAVTGLQTQATSAYVSAQDKVASAQQRIADIQISAIQATERAAYDAAKTMRDLGKTLSDFANSKAMSADQNFASTLKKALAGDTDAMSALPGAATAASDFAATNAGSAADARLAQSRIMADVMRVANIASATALPGMTAEADPMIAANAALVSAQAEMGEALRVVGAIGAATATSVSGLIAQYSAAQNALVAAQVDYNAAKQVLEDIKKNTGDTRTSVASLKEKFTIELALAATTSVTDYLTIEATALSEAQRDTALAVLDGVTRTIDLVADTLTESERDAALSALVGVSRTVKIVADHLTGLQADAALAVLDGVTRTVSLTVTKLEYTQRDTALAVLENVTKSVALTATRLTDAQKNDALAVLDGITKTVGLAATKLTGEQVDIALSALDGISANVNLVLNAAMTDAHKSAAISAIGLLEKSVALVLNSTTIDEAQKYGAVAAIGNLSKLVDLTLASNVSEAAKVIAINGIGYMTKAVATVLDSSGTTQAQRDAAVAGLGYLSKTVPLILASQAWTDAQKQTALTAIGNLSKDVTLTATLSAASLAKISADLLAAMTVSGVTATGAATTYTGTELVSAASDLTASGATPSEIVSAAASSGISTADLAALAAASGQADLIAAAAVAKKNDDIYAAVRYHGEALGYGTEALLKQLGETARDNAFTHGDVIAAMNAKGDATWTEEAYAAWLNKFDPSGSKLYAFAKGTNYLPNDMVAQVHEGERIIPAADNRELMQRLQSPSSNNEVMVSEIKALREDNAAQARAMVQLQQRLTKLMERWDGSGMPETRVVA